MKVQKTIERLVVTLKHGFFRARESVRVCEAGCVHPSGELLTRRSEALQRLVPVGATYGYDLEVFIGLQRFVHYRQREEIRSALKIEYGISLSSGEISVLTARFLSHLEELHLAHTEDIRNTFIREGGYHLHIDATGEDGRGTLFVAYAGNYDWVLGSWKIPTERSDAMVPHLEEEVVKKFGDPRAIVRDLGRAVAGAVTELVEKMEHKPRVLACHLHFLNDVGKDHLKFDHDLLRQHFRNFSVRPKLASFVREMGRKLGEKVPSLRECVDTWAKGSLPLPPGPAGLATVRALGQWVLDYSHDSKYQKLPFGRPYYNLFQRCCTVTRAIDTIKQASIDQKVRQALERLSKVVVPITKDAAVQTVARRLETRVKLFDGLRNVLRIDNGKSQDCPNVITLDDRADLLRKMEQSFTDFSKTLQERRASQDLTKDEREMLDVVLSHLKRHGQYLWGHVLQIPDEAGGGFMIVDRTNNCLEGFFHLMKHGERRRSGRKVLTQDFEGLPAAAALALNLTHPDYVKLVCGSLDSLPSRFSDLDIARREAKLAKPKGSLVTSSLPLIVSAALPLPDRRLVRLDSFCDRIQAASQGQVSLPPKFIPNPS
jgi:sulfur relay (sulfurtransferase) DsrC/TusE family protein